MSQQPIRLAELRLVQSATQPARARLTPGDHKRLRGVVAFGLRMALEEQLSALYRLAEQRLRRDLDRRPAEQGRAIRAGWSRKHPRTQQEIWRTFEQRLDAGLPDAVCQLLLDCPIPIDTTLDQFIELVAELVSLVSAYFVLQWADPAQPQPRGDVRRVAQAIRALDRQIQSLDEFGQHQQADERRLLACKARALQVCQKYRQELLAEARQGFSGAPPKRGTRCAVDLDERLATMPPGLRRTHIAALLFALFGESTDPEALRLRLKEHRRLHGSLPSA